jgi:prepilin-type N-terminal cleavage/methylation domain-containing protein
MKKGFSVIEVLVVVGVFAIIGILATQSTTLSLRSTKKSDSIVLVKQELDNASGNIERLLQTASAVIIGKDCTTDHTATPSVGFRNSNGFRGDIACIDSPPSDFPSNNDPRIASSSGETINYNQRLTSSKILITECSFICFSQNSQTYVDFSISANAKGIVGAEGASVTTSKKILVRGANRK